MKRTGTQLVDLAAASIQIADDGFGIGLPYVGASKDGGAETVSRLSAILFKKAVEDNDFANHVLANARWN